MNKLLLIVMAAALSGCGTTYTATVLSDKIDMPADVAQTCDALVDINPTNMGELYTAFDNLIAQYGECWSRDRAKYLWIKGQNSAVPTAPTK